MHSLATTNVSLHQELGRACKSIETSHAQNVEFEAPLDNLAMTDPATEARRGDAAEGLDARITVLTKRLKI